DQLVLGSRAHGRVLKCGHVCPSGEWPKAQRATSRLAKYRRIGSSELQKCTVNRKEISFTRRQQPMNRITLPPWRRDELVPVPLTEMHPIPHGPGAHRNDTGFQRISQRGRAIGEPGLSIGQPKRPTHLPTFFGVILNWRAATVSHPAVWEGT